MYIDNTNGELVMLDKKTLNQEQVVDLLSRKDQTENSSRNVPGFMTPWPRNTKTQGSANYCVLDQSERVI